MVASVARGRAAQIAGIDPGDELIAIGGKRVEGGSLDGVLAECLAGQDIQVTVARDGRLIVLELRTEKARPKKVRIVPNDGATPAEQALGRAWLSSP
jgi:predicted metalloprotease with PDZ domain